ncbi:MAG: pyruvate:ferredoxin (flavodoxin) oxidoreductase [Alphaproteobacteria bacterium]
MTEQHNAVTGMMDGNEAAASVAHRLNEVVIIYPITPSSPMGEFADAWAAQGKKNIWGAVPEVAEMQSEAGAAGACHGAVQAGTLCTTFTASQGLLLMIPNMYKIAGELSPFVMHVAARSLATHALSIFGDHSDVMACRQVGFAMLCSNSVQEAHDLACISQAASIRSRVPFMHFFDGFRTSHEIAKINLLSDDDLKAMMAGLPIHGNVERALTPDHPVIRGTAQNPDVYFQGREASNKFYDDCPEIVAEEMERFAKISGRKYDLVEYVGAEDAENVIVCMGSGAETIHEVVDYMNANGGKVGLLKVRLYRPFPAKAFINAIPKTAKVLSVLDRTKETGSVGEPLYLDVTVALNEALVGGSISKMPKVLGGRYGLSSKEFTPAMVKAVYDNAVSDKSKNHFTVGINDDVTHLSLPFDEHFDTEPSDVVKAVFYGLGADGTVGANKNSIKIIADQEGRYGQGYFVYDSKKSGAMTVSHLRFGGSPIRSTYLVKKSKFVACHHFPFLQKMDVLREAEKGAVFLLNAPYTKADLWDNLPKEVQKDIIEKELKVYAIDAVEVAKNVGMGRRINTIMQTCFFAISGVLPKDEAIKQIKKAIQKTYGKKSQELVERNYAAVDATLEHLYQIDVPKEVSSKQGRLAVVPENATEFVKNVTAKIMEGKGEDLPVSALPIDGTWPTATAQYEKRAVATEIPIWNPSVCIQCGKCAMVCPHGCLRQKVADPKDLEKAPKDFISTDYKGKEFVGKKFIIQISPEDCTGCTLCTQVCPAKNKENPKEKAVNMTPIYDVLEREHNNFEFFLSLPDVKRTELELKTPKQVQLLRPLFEFSGACAGCGETPYIKLMSQLFGDRLVIANATGCSSIYGGNLPTTPYTVDENGRGPAWANSLFEDNAEFGLGMRYAIDQQHYFASLLLKDLASEVGETLASSILDASMKTDAEIEEQRTRVAELKSKLQASKNPKAKHLEKVADYLVRKSVWILGGDGWAYDIGYGGLDHVLNMGRNVNILVMDTGVYSNTGGQQSKATPIGASAKFASAGKAQPKKDLGMIAMSSGSVYVAQIALGASDTQTIKAFVEAESFDGPSIIIAYSHCIAHGYDLSQGLEQQKIAVESGLWPLYRFDPRRSTEGQAPLILDSKEPKRPVSDFMNNETRFKIVKNQNPERYEHLVAFAQEQVESRYKLYSHLAALGAKTAG